MTPTASPMPEPDEIDRPGWIPPLPRLVYPLPVPDPALRDGRGARPDTVHIRQRRSAA